MRFVKVPGREKLVGVQAGIGNQHFLRQGRGHKTGQDQQGQNERSDEGNDDFHFWK